MIIDLSNNNNVLDWDDVKENVTRVILRCALRGYRYNNIKRDPRFDEYAEACNKRNIPLGIYFMSQAINEQEAIEEALYTIEAAKLYNAELPLFIDSEWSHEPHDGRADFLSKEQRTAVVKAFCNKINEFGYVGGVYACESWFTEHLIYNDVKNFYVWVADYGQNTGEIVSVISLPKYDLFQFTSNRRIPGIQNPVDCSVYPNETMPKTERTVSNMPVLRKGSSGKAVRIWQIIVGAEPDGNFGPLTEEATTSFQKRYSIDVDGVVGPQSWSTGFNSF